jgi:hypothetical protein
VCHLADSRQTRGLARRAWRKLRNFPRRLTVGIAKRTAWINRRPLIILGVQKSGTTAIAALIGKATGMRVATDFIHQSTSIEYLRTLFDNRAFGDFVRRNRYYFASDIIKDPGLTFFSEELVEYFPRGRFIFIARDPRDNIRSILNRVNLPGKSVAPDQTHWSSLQNGESWQMIVEGQLPVVSGNTCIEKLAHRWNLGVELYLKHRDKMHLIRYEDFLQDKVGSISKLLIELGLEPHYSIVDWVDVQFQPRGNREVTWENFFGRQNLERIEAICGDQMARFGYTASQPGAISVTGSTGDRVINGC